MSEEKSIQDGLAKKVELKKILRKLASAPNDPNLTIVESFDRPITVPVQPPPIWLENALKDKSTFNKIDWLKEKESRRLMVNRLFSAGTIRRIL